MSRTKRYIPHWARNIRPFEKTWIGLGYDQKYCTGEDPRNRIENGYDHHFAMSNVYTRYPKRWTDRDSYVGKTRKFYKRAYHKGRRILDKKHLREFDYES